MMRDDLVHSSEIWTDSRQGIHAAREFTQAHFMSRYLDMTTLFKFNNPKHVLSSVVSQHLAQAGVSHQEGVGKIESRYVACHLVSA